MYLKDQLEQLAKENAFEYDAQWWNHQQKIEGAKDRIGGNIVAFYKGHNIFNGVVALWGRDKRSAVLFYTTPHDVADERKYGWIPPVFRVEVRQDSCFRVPKNPKAATPGEEPAELDAGIARRVVQWDQLVAERPQFIEDLGLPLPAIPPPGALQQMQDVAQDMAQDIEQVENEHFEELIRNANRW